MSDEETKVSSSYKLMREGFPFYTVRLRADAYWCNFSIAEADGDDDEASVGGFVKWDGCMEFQHKLTLQLNASVHLCRVPTSVTDLFEAINAMLRLAHEAMEKCEGQPDVGVDWDPPADTGYYTVSVEVLS